MKSSRTLLVLAVFLAAAVGCDRKEKSGDDKNHGLSASEIFSLRSQCADLGRKLLAGGVHGPDVRAEQKSSYNAVGNRCYVELDFSLAEAGSPDDRSTRYLYDGQTQQMLAWIRLDREGNNPERIACGVNDARLGLPDDSACGDINAKIADMMRSE